MIYILVLISKEEIMDLKINTKFSLKIAATLGFALCTATQTTMAQEHQKAHIGLVYPISTNGTNAASISNTISLHALAGLSAGEDGVAISGLSTIIKGNQSGAVVSGLSNTISGSANGTQVAGIVNIIGGTSSGVTVAGLVNVAKSTKGVQAAGLVNLSAGNANAQLAGLSNVSKEATVQIAGLSNTAKNNSDIQIAGLVNTSGNSKGQIAGLINISKKAKGTQIAGLVNIAEESNYPIGFVNIIKKGEKQIGATIDEVGNSVIAFRSGGKYTYGIVGAGYNIKMENAPYILEVGLGGRISFSKILRLNIEVSNTVNTDFWNDAYYKSSFRPLLGLTLAKRLEIVAGPSFNYVNYMSNLKTYRENTVYNFFGSQAINSLFFGGLLGVHIKI